MNDYTPKNYQQQVLDSVQAYFEACQAQGSASIAYMSTTEALWGRANAYHPLPEFEPEMPYFCLRDRKSVV